MALAHPTAARTREPDGSRSAYTPHPRDSARHPGVVSYHEPGQVSLSTSQSFGLAGPFTRFRASIYFLLVGSVFGSTI